MAIRPAPIRTLWLGRCGVRGRYLIEAKARKEPLSLELIMPSRHEYMTIPYNQIDNLCISSTRKPVKEIMGHDYKDYLFHFIWKPDPEGVQRPMF